MIEMILWAVGACYILYYGYMNTQESIADRRWKERKEELDAEAAEVYERLSWLREGE